MISKELLRRWMAQREEYDKKKADAEDAKEARDATALEIHEALTGAGVPSITIDIGPPWGEVRFVPNATTYGDIYDEDKLLEWVNERAMTEELTNPKFVKRRINELAKRAKAAKTNPPPGVEIRETPYVTPTIINKPKRP